MFWNDNILFWSRSRYVLQGISHKLEGWGACIGACSRVQRSSAPGSPPATRSHRPTDRCTWHTWRWEEFIRVSELRIRFHLAVPKIFSWYTRYQKRIWQYGKWRTQVPLVNSVLWGKVMCTTELGTGEGEDQGVTTRCRLSWLTNSALASYAGGGGLRLRGLSQWVQLCTSHVTWSPNKLLEIYLHILPIRGGQSWARIFKQ